MMKLVAISTLAISTFALATNPGVYIGLNLGYGGMDTPKLTQDTFKSEVRSSASLRGFSGRVNAGYLWSKNSINYGAELGYATYENNQYSAWNAKGRRFNVIYSGYNIDLLGVIQYDFTPNWNILGKAGVAYVSQKTTGGFTRTNDNKNTILPEIALGAGYKFANGVGLNLTASHIFGSQPTALGKDNINKIASVDMITVGISYSF
uniref:outer membrane protein n=1 Tax=Piscirickettsia salmonis TaxID=1238 RepID=UPI0039F7148C